MEERIANEGELYRRYEQRIVLVELHCEDFVDFIKKYGPLVDQLREDATVALRVAAALKEQRGVVLTRVQIAIACAALCFPTILGYVLFRVFGRQ